MIDQYSTPPATWGIVLKKENFAGVVLSAGLEEGRFFFCDTRNSEDGNHHPSFVQAAGGQSIPHFRKATDLSHPISYNPETGEAQGDQRQKERPILFP